MPWVTINGAHVFLKEGENAAEHFANVGGVKVTAGKPDRLVGLAKMDAARGADEGARAIPLQAATRGYIGKTADSFQPLARTEEHKQAIADMRAVSAKAADKSWSPSDAVKLDAAANKLRPLANNNTRAEELTDMHEIAICMTSTTPARHAELMKGDFGKAEQFAKQYPEDQTAQKFSKAIAAFPNTYKAMRS